jgi:polyhydroxybutyrate depolymerase
MKYILVSLLTLNFYGQSQIMSDSLLIEGHYRVFHYKKPEIDSKGFSLVFVLHGSGGNGPQMMQRVTSFNSISDKEKMIAVFPTGYKNFWNECRKIAPSAANVEQINEEAFFTGMIDYFSQRFKIDQKKVFAIGTSGGGHMAYKLALTIPDKFRSITAIIANLPTDENLDCQQSKKPLNVLIVNGTADKTNPYEGGAVMLSSGNFGEVRSTEETFQYWAKLAGYKNEPVHSYLPDNNTKDGKTIEKYAYTGKQKEVILLKVNGGKHDYPGDIDVHLYAWQFFKSSFRLKSN